MPVDSSIVTDWFVTHVVDRALLNCDRVVFSLTWGSVNFECPCLIETYENKICLPVRFAFACQFGICRAAEYRFHL